MKNETVPKQIVSWHDWNDNMAQALIGNYYYLYRVVAKDHDTDTQLYDKVANFGNIYVQNIVRLISCFSSKSTKQTVNGKETCNDFFQTQNDFFNAYIDKHMKQSLIDYNIKIELFAIFDKWLKSELERVLLYLRTTPMVYSIMKHSNNNNSCITPLLIKAIHEKNTHMGSAMSVSYSKCVKNKAIPHILTLLSNTPLIIDSNKKSNALAVEYVDEFKEQGNKFCFIHMSYEKSEPVLFPNNENELTDDTSRNAIQMTTPTSKEDCVLAYKLCGYDSLECVKLISTYSNCCLPHKRFLYLCSG